MSDAADRLEAERRRLLTTTGREPALDGLRGIAIFLVVLFHAQHSAWGFGWVGVDLFFVLSGFLIGGQLLDLETLDGSAVRGFYIRRAFRILPLYLLLLGAVAAARASGNVAAGGAEPAWQLATLTQNFWYGTGGRGGDIPGATWSLAVEEHFYLLLPPTLLLLRRRHVWLVAVTVIAGVLAFRFFALRHWGNPGIYYLTPSRIDEPIAGVLLAWYKRRYPISLRLAGFATVVGATSIFVAVLALQSSGVIGSPWSYLVNGAASAGAIALATSPTWLAGALARSQVLRWLGTRAYGIYLTHHGLMRGMENLPWPREGGVATAVGVVLSLLLAELLWRTVERPMIQLGKRLSARPMAAANPAT